jgi:hypothetical protein
MAVSAIVTAVSMAYQAVQAKKARKRQKAMEKAAREAEDARKGFQITVDGEASTLPICYGRNKVGGVRVFHHVASSYTYAASNADWHHINGGLKRNRSGSKSEFLFFQQALAYSGISAVKDVIIDDSMLITDSRLRKAENDEYWGWNDAAIRVDVHYNGSKSDSMMSANVSSRATALFSDCAYASVVVKLNRNDPLFSAVPNLAFFVEGKKIRGISNGALTAKTYSNNPALVLLDYLLEHKQIDLNDVDLPSFESAANICSKIVVDSAPTGGQIHQPSLGSGAEVRAVPLYEANLLVDTSKPFRDNIEEILETMGDARLVWSQGKFKLVLAYPGVNNAGLENAPVVTDDDLLEGADFEITWPQADTRYNRCVVKYAAEEEDFKTAAAAWPPELDELKTIPLGALRYQPVSGWDVFKAGAFLNDFGVWDADKPSAVFIWTFVAKESGAHTLSYVLDTSGSIELDLHENYVIPEDRSLTAARGASALVSGSDSGGDWEDRKSRINSKSVYLNKGEVYLVRISASGTDNRRGVAATITAPSGVMSWHTQEISHTDFLNVEKSKDAYLEMLAEDNNVKLETEVYIAGITDYYHALAKAEEIVRTSRSAAGVTFEYLLADRYFEPGDIVRISSKRLQLGVNTDFFVKVDEVEPREDGTCLVNGTRFDWTQLAWNVDDAVYAKPNPVTLPEFSAPMFLSYVPNQYDTLDSAGSLTWPLVYDSRVLEYALYMHVGGDVDENGLKFFKLLGHAAQPPFSLPNLKYSNLVFGIRSIGADGLRSEMVTTITINVSKAVPPTPSSVTSEIAGDRRQSVRLTWTTPLTREDGSSYDNHYTTLIFRGVSPVFEEAEFIGSTQSMTSYLDTPPVYGELHYWVVLSSYAGVQGLPAAAPAISVDYYETIVDITFDPPAPTNLTANGVFTTVQLEWVNPTYVESGGRFATIILAAKWTDGLPAPSLLDATVVGLVEGGTMFGHSVEPGEKWSYWVKSKSLGNAVSSNAAGPATAETSELASTVLDAVEGSITDTQLHSDLTSRIDLIDGPDTLAGSVNSRIKAEEAARLLADSDLSAAILNEQTVREDADETLAQNISAIGAKADSNAAAILAEQTARADADSALASDISQLSTTVGSHTTTLQTQATSINGLSASYTVKIDNNGRVAGYGLASEPNAAGDTTSSFVVSADKFGIFHPSASSQLVFGVESGKTVMSGAYIKDASIDSAKIANAAIDSAKITNGAITSAKIGDAAVGSAKLAGLLLSDNYSATSGWAIYRSGQAIFNDATLRGTAQSSNYDSYSAGWQLRNDGSFTLRGAGGTVLLSTDGIPAGSISDLGRLAYESRIDNPTYIANAVVDTLHLAGHAVTMPVGVSNDGIYSMSRLDQYYEIIRLSIVSTGAPIICTFSTIIGQRDVDPADPSYPVLKFYRDGKIFIDRRLYAREGGGTTYTMSFIDTPGEGNFTYYLEINKMGSSSYARETSIVLMEAKR